MKTASRILMTLIVLVFFTGISFAQDASVAKAAKASGQTVTTAPGKFVDTNKNGVCDNHEAKGASGQGKNFVDKNGDGKCDNNGSLCKGKGQGNCCGKGQGCCTGSGKGAGKGACGQGHQYRHGTGQGTGTTNPQPGK
jgi:hypothetical protein